MGGVCVQHAGLDRPLRVGVPGHSRAESLPLRSGHKHLDLKGCWLGATVHPFRSMKSFLPATRPFDRQLNQSGLFVRLLSV